MIRTLVKAKGGFTLVESVLAAMILGIAVGACILSFSMSMRAVNTASNQMAALHIARNELETLRTNSFSSAALSAGSYVFTNTGAAGTYVVTNIDSNTKNVTVNVPYVNHIRGGCSPNTGYSTNTLVTSLVSTLH